MGIDMVGIVVGDVSGQNRHKHLRIIANTSSSTSVTNDVAMSMLDTRVETRGIFPTKMIKSADNISNLSPTHFIFTNICHANNIEGPTN